MHIGKNVHMHIDMYIHTCKYARTYMFVCMNHQRDITFYTRHFPFLCLVVQKKLHLSLLCRSFLTTMMFK